MVVRSVLLEILMPATVIVGLKKSKTLLLVTMLLALLFGLADPSDITHLVGRLAPAGPRLLFEMVLPVLAPPVEVLNRTFPPAVVVPDVDEPRTEQFVTVLFCAPLMKRIVLVLAVAEAVVFEIVSELPPVLSPLIVTLSAPFKSINGLPATIAPETVRAAPPDGWIKTEV
jgi:hypothetical protein